jgi:hypothetical protein
MFKFRTFWLEPSRFITQRRETGRPIPIQMQKNGQLLCNSQGAIILFVIFCMIMMVVMFNLVRANLLRY